MLQKPGSSYLRWQVIWILCFTGDKTGSKGGKTEKQDSKDSKVGDEKGKAGKPGAEQEDKPPPLPSAYDEDLMLRAAMYGVLFQAYADKASYYLNKRNKRIVLLDTVGRYL